MKQYLLILLTLWVATMRYTIALATPLAKQPVSVLDSLQANSELENFVPVNPLNQPILLTPEISKKQRELAEEMVIQRAWMSSCIVPGWGQAYNGHYGKIPVMYTLFMGLGGGAFYNHNYYQKFNGETEVAYYRDAANQHRTLRDLFLIFMGMIYIGNVIDAYAGANLKTFNLSDDISVELQPQVPTLETSEGGLNLSINFRL